MFIYNILLDFLQESSFRRQNVNRRPYIIQGVLKLFFSDKAISEIRMKHIVIQKWFFYVILWKNTKYLHVVNPRHLDKYRSSKRLPKNIK